MTPNACGIRIVNARAAGKMLRFLDSVCAVSRPRVLTQPVRVFRTPTEHTVFEVGTQWSTIEEWLRQKETSYA